MALMYERNRVTAERQIAATEARVHFGELTRDVERTGEHVLVERNGHPVVVVVPVEEFRRLQRRRDNEELLASLRETREAWREAFRGVDMPPAAELIREGRDDYDDWVAWNRANPAP